MIAHALGTYWARRGPFSRPGRATDPIAEQWRSAVVPVKVALIVGGDVAVHGVCTVTGLGAAALTGS